MSGIEPVGPLPLPHISPLEQPQPSGFRAVMGAAPQDWPVGQEQEVDPVQFTANALGQDWLGPQATGALPTPVQNAPPKAGAGHSQAPYMTVGPYPAGPQVSGHHPPGIGAGVSPMMTRVTVL